MNKRFDQYWSKTVVVTPDPALDNFWRNSVTRPAAVGLLSMILFGAPVFAVFVYLVAWFFWSANRFEKLVGLVHDARVVQEADAFEHRPSKIEPSVSRHL